MYSTKIRNSSPLRRASALAAVGVAAITLGCVTPAHADPNNGPTGQPGKGCAVEDEHGNVTYVEVGTQIGLFHCGADGEWHFGWLTNGRLVAPPSSPTAVTGVVATGATTRAQ